MKVKDLDSLLKRLRENPYVFVVLALGLVLLLLPTGEAEQSPPAQPESRELNVPAFSVKDEQERLCSVLESISGVGKAKVLLSLKSTATRELAFSGGEAVILSMGSGKQQAVEEGYVYPEYLGAVIVCQGAGSAKVRLQVCDAVSAFTGLGMNSIQVLKME